jgi:hypothetical protein
MPERPAPGAQPLPRAQLASDFWPFAARRTFSLRSPMPFTSGQDQLDLHLITSAGQAPTTLVRAIEDASNASTTVEVDPDGSGASSGWVPLALLDGLHAGDLFSVVLAGQSATLAVATTHFGPATPSISAFGPWAGGWSSDDTYPREVADVNGDGMADIIGFGQYGVWVALATGNGNFAQPGFELSAFGVNAGGWSSDDAYPREVADVNGDGMADIIGFGNAGVYVFQTARQCVVEILDQGKVEWHVDAGCHREPLGGIEPGRHHRSLLQRGLESDVDQPDVGAAEQVGGDHAGRVVTAPEDAKRAARIASTSARVSARSYVLGPRRSAPPPAAIYRSKLQITLVWPH